MEKLLTAFIGNKLAEEPVPWLHVAFILLLPAAKRQQQHQSESLFLPDRWVVTVVKFSVLRMSWSWTMDAQDAKMQSNTNSETNYSIFASGDTWKSETADGSHVVAPVNDSKL